MMTTRRRLDVVEQEQTGSSDGGSPAIGALAEFEIVEADGTGDR